MTIYLILMVFFADKHPPISVKFLVLGGVEPCVTMVHDHLMARPPPVMDGHPVKGWSATCSAELPSDPA